MNRLRANARLNEAPPHTDKGTGWRIFVHRSAERPPLSRGGTANRQFGTIGPCQHGSGVNMRRLFLVFLPGAFLASALFMSACSAGDARAREQQPSQPQVMAVDAV